MAEMEVPVFDDELLVSKLLFNRLGCNKYCIGYRFVCKNYRFKEITLKNYSF